MQDLLTTYNELLPKSGCINHHHQYDGYEFPFAFLVQGRTPFMLTYLLFPFITLPQLPPYSLFNFVTQPLVDLGHDNIYVYVRLFVYVVTKKKPAAATKNTVDNDVVR